MNLHSLSDCRIILNHLCAGTFEVPGCVQHLHTPETYLANLFKSQGKPNAFTDAVSEKLNACTYEQMRVMRCLLMLVEQMPEVCFKNAILRIVDDWASRTNKEEREIAAYALRTLAAIVRANKSETSVDYAFWIEKTKQADCGLEAFNGLREIDLGFAAERLQLFLWIPRVTKTQIGIMLRGMKRDATEQGIDLAKHLAVFMKGHPQLFSQIIDVYVTVFTEK